MQQASEVTQEIRALIGELRRDRARGNTQTVVHKSSAGGFITGIAVAACIGSFFFTMYVARTLNNDLRDMKAWQDVLRSKVSVIEGKLNGAKP